MMNAKNKFYAYLLLSLVSGQVAAEVVSQSLPYETRLQRFSYQKNRTYEILTRPMSPTDIQLEADEKYIAMPVGDNETWEIGDIDNHVFIKPIYPRMVNPATLITNKRTYQIIFKSTTDDGIWYQRVHWDIPKKGMDFNLSNNSNTLNKNLVQNAGANNISPPFDNASYSDTDSSVTIGGDIDSVKKLNFDYKITGDAEFKPSQVFDDGKFTWLQMPKEAQIFPAFFVKNGDDLHVVNFVVKGKYIVIQRLAEEILLKYGESEVLVKKNKNKNWWDS